MECVANQPTRSQPGTVTIVHLTAKVDKQDFLQVFQGSGMGKMEDNLTSVDPSVDLIQLMDPG